MAGPCKPLVCQHLPPLCLIPAGALSLEWRYHGLTSMGVSTKGAYALGAPAPILTQGLSAETEAGQRAEELQQREEELISLKAQLQNRQTEMENRDAELASLKQVRPISSHDPLT